MFDRTIEETCVNRRWNTEYVRRMNVFLCDECNVSYVLRYKASYVGSSMLTFCSMKCRTTSRKTGKLSAKVQALMMQQHGVKFGSQVIGASQKMLATRLKTYNTIAPIYDNDDVSQKFKKTMFDRYGVEHPSKSEELQAKKVKTYQERYRVENPLCKGSPFRPSHDQLSKAGQSGYRSTNRQNGWMISKPERLLFEYLCRQFSDVKQQVPVHHGTNKSWLIDVYVRDINTYVQLDGEFWHGLDRPYEELHPNGKKSYDADRQQDEWFRSHDMRLVRVTDKQLLACWRTNDWSSIAVKLGGC